MQRKQIHYRNTDLDLFSARDLVPLADALANRGIFALRVSPYEDDQGLWLAMFETEEKFSDADKNIAAILTAIEAFDEPSRGLWDACSVREFNIGYDCGNEPYAFSQKLTVATLTRIASVGAALVITLYPVDF